MESKLPNKKLLALIPSPKYSNTISIPLFKFMLLFFSHLSICIHLSLTRHFNTCAIIANTKWERIAVKCQMWKLKFNTSFFFFSSFFFFLLLLFLFFYTGSIILKSIILWSCYYKLNKINLENWRTWKLLLKEEQISSYCITLFIY